MVDLRLETVGLVLLSGYWGQVDVGERRVTMLVDILYYCTNLVSPYRVHQ